MKPEEIKQHTNKNVRIKYTNKKLPYSYVGKIVYNLEEHFIFKITNSNEISIRYDWVECIETIKTFESYIKKANELYEEKEYQKAFDIVFELKEYETFKLPEQIKIIDAIIGNCKVNLFHKKINEVESIDKIKEGDK